MTFCIFQRTDDPLKHRCSRSGCGNEIRTDHPPEQCYAECRDIHGPPILERAFNLAKAVFHQLPLAAEAILTGDESKAFRSQAEIETIAATCKACPLFDGTVCTHQNCGCPIDAERTAWWSKIAWRSQKCPDEPARWG